MNSAPRRPSLFARLLTMLAVLVLLVAAVPAAAGAPLEPAGSVRTQTRAAPLQNIDYGNRRILLPLVRNSAPTPPPPQISASLVIRPVPLNQVQRGNELSVEYRYTNTGPILIESAGISLFYPQRLTNFQDVNQPAGDTLSGWDGTRVDVRLINVQPGEVRTGRINFTVRRDAGIGERIRLFADFTCQFGTVPCRSNLAEVEVIRNDDESTSGGTFNLTVSPDRGPPGTAHTMVGSFFRPGEEIITWMNTSTGAYPLPITTRADRNGNITIVYGTGGLVPGYYSLVAHGRQSNVEGVGAFIVTNPTAAVVGELDPAALLSGGVAIPGAAEPRPAPVPAQASGLGGVAGRVVDAAGTGVAGVPIEVRDAAGALAQTAVSRADGVYFVAVGLASGNYTITAAPSRSSSLAALQFLGDVSSGPVTVTAPEITRNVNLTLPAAGVVQGTASADGVAVVGATVALRDGTGAVVRFGTSAPDGAYRIASVPPGNYTLVIDPRGAVRGGSLGVSRADVTVVAGEVATAVAAVRSSSTTGELVGRVTDAGTGVGIDDVVVMITDRGSGTVAIASTDAQGRYASGALAPGAYSVQFLPSFSEVLTTTRYVGEFYNDAQTFASSAAVTVAAGQATTADASLAQGGSIAGRVTGDGAGLAEVFVVAYGADGLPAGVAFSEAEGNYTVRGVRAGTYTLRFVTALSSNQTTRNFQNGAYDTTPETPAPTEVSVAAGQAVTAVNQVLGRGVQIVGTVTAADTGAGLPGVYVLFYDAVTAAPVSIALSDGEGRYGSSGLVRGLYKVRYTTVFSPDPAARTYIDEYFSNAPNFASARSVIVTDPGPRVLNAELERGGSISGRVSAADTGAGLAGVVVVARDGQSVTAVTTDLAGAYTLTGLAAGQYSIEFIPDLSPDPRARRYQGELYDNVVAGGQGTPVTVVVEQDTPDIDAELALRQDS